MAIYFRILAWEMPWTEEPGRATVHGVTKRVRRDLMINNNNKESFCDNIYLLQLNFILSGLQKS